MCRSCNSFIFFQVLLLSSLVIGNKYRLGKQQKQADLCSDTQFWSREFRSCLPCTPCIVPIVMCSAEADAVCGSVEDPNMDDDEEYGMDDGKVLMLRSESFESGRVASSTKTDGFSQIRRRESATKFVRDSMINSSKHDDDFLKKLRQETEKLRKKQKPNSAEEIDGRVRYSATAEGRQRKNDLHSDLQAIERELLSGPEETIGTPSTTTTEGSVPARTDIVIGKKRLYAAPPSTDQDLVQMEEEEKEIQKDVFGAVRSKPDNGKHELAGGKHQPDEFGLLHSLLYKATGSDS